MIVIQVNTLPEWRRQARELLMRGVTPNGVAWESQQHSLFVDDEKSPIVTKPIVHSQLRIPQAFFSLAESVACFRDDRKWSLLYSVAWRILFEDKGLLSMVIDKQVSQLLAMQKAVSRDKHKMAAFVRFKSVNIVDAENDVPTTYEHYVAWFEPEHLIVREKSPFFRKRFSNMCWSILTPDLCAHWNREELTFTSGIAKPPNIDDDLERLWLTYYKNIFNPARLKVKAMQSEMPKKYWKNLPEAVLIKSLVSGSSKQSDAMLKSPSAPDKNYIMKSQFVKQQQEKLRGKRKEMN
jgi:uracil-DNA glycosylase